MHRNLRLTIHNKRVESSAPLYLRASLFRVIALFLIARQYIPKIVIREDPTFSSPALSSVPSSLCQYLPHHQINLAGAPRKMISDSKKAATNLASLYQCARNAVCL